MIELIVVCVVMLLMLLIIRIRCTKYCREEGNLPKENQFGIARLVYFLSTLVIIALTMILEIISNRPELTDVRFGVLLLYIGIGGLITKFGMLKLPISHVSKIHTVINIILIIIATLKFVDYYF